MVARSFQRVWGLYDRLYERLVQVMLYMGGLVLLASRVVGRMWQRPFAVRALLHQLETVGVQSTLIAAVIAMFSSMVLTIQMAVPLTNSGIKDQVSRIINMALMPELSPMLTALMVGARVGAGITAEIGSMSVTEQIDAMRSMGADPVRKLVIPRVVATVIILPLLTTLSTLIGLFGAILIGWLSLGIAPRTFWESAMNAVSLEDFVRGFVKPLFFAFSIALFACYQGLRTQGGTKQVGESTTQTVVLVSIATLVLDFILTNLLFGLRLY